MREIQLRWDAIVIAGGRASRLGGIEKTALRYRGRTLLDLALDAVDGAESVALIGDPGRSPLRSNVTSVWEDPRFGGPAAAISAGLDVLRQEFPPEWTVVLAADLVRAPEAVALILSALDSTDGAAAAAAPALADGVAAAAAPASADGAIAVGAADAADRAAAAAARDGLIAVDDAGQRQPLLAVYRTAALQRAVDALRTTGPLPGRSMRQLIVPLELREVPLPSELCRDIDTAADAAEHGISLDTDTDTDTDTDEPQGEPE